MNMHPNRKWSLHRGAVLHLTVSFFKFKPIRSPYFCGFNKDPFFSAPNGEIPALRGHDLGGRINFALLTPLLTCFNLRSVGFYFFQSLILRSARYLIVRFRLATKSRGKSLNKIGTYFHEIFINILVLNILCEKVKNRKVFFFIPLSK